MAEPVVIPNRPLIARLLALFWAAEVVVGLLFAFAGYRLLGPAENGGAVALLVIGLVLAAAGVVMAGLCLRSGMLAGAAVEMSAAGLLDRRLSAARIPWDAITWKVIFNGRAYSLQMDVARPLRTTLAIAWPYRALGLLSRLLRQPELTVATLGTGLSAHQIAERMARFKAPAG